MRHKGHPLEEKLQGLPMDRRNHLQGHKWIRENRAFQILCGPGHPVQSQRGIEKLLPFTKAVDVRNQI